MNIFLTGGSGFLGSHIAQALCENGHTVFALVRKNSNREHLQYKNLHFVEGSLPECDFDFSVLESCDAVIHCAGLVKALSREDFFKINAKGTEKLVSLLLKLKYPPKHFIHISTLAVVNPEKDGDDFCISLSHCHPLSLYGQSKLAGEKALEKLKDKMMVSILRPPVLYGPRDFELEPVFKLAALGLAPLFGNGGNRFSICHAKDVATAILTLLKEAKISDIYCLDDGQALSWKEFLKAIGVALNQKLFYLNIPEIFFSAAAEAADLISKLRNKAQIFGSEKIKEMKIKSWVCGYQKLNEKFGWEPKIKLEEGLKECLEFYRK